MILSLPSKTLSRQLFLISGAALVEDSEVRWDGLKIISKPANRYSDSRVMEAIGVCGDMECSLMFITQSNNSGCAAISEMVCCAAWTLQTFTFKDTKSCRCLKPLLKAVILCHFSASLFFFYGKIQKQNGGVGLCCSTFKPTVEISTFLQEEELAPPLLLCKMLRPLQYIPHAMKNHPLGRNYAGLVWVSLNKLRLHEKAPLNAIMSKSL